MKPLINSGVTIKLSKDNKQLIILYDTHTRQIKFPIESIYDLTTYALNNLKIDRSISVSLAKKKGLVIKELNNLKE